MRTLVLLCGMGWALAASGEPAASPVRDVKVTTTAERRMLVWVDSGGDTNLHLVSTSEDGDGVTLLLRNATLKRGRVFMEEGVPTAWASQEPGHVRIRVAHPAGLACHAPARLNATRVGWVARFTCNRAPPAPPPSVTAAATATTHPKTDADVESERAAPEVMVPAVASKASHTPQAGVGSVAVPPSAAPVETGSSAVAVLGFLLLLSLAALAAVLVSKARKTGSPAALQVIQTHALGPRRSISVAKVAGRTLVLSNSEAGIQLLLSVEDGAPATLALPSLEGLTAAAPAPLAPETTFAGLMRQSDEDAALREKLSTGRLARLN